MRAAEKKLQDVQEACSFPWDETLDKKPVSGFCVHMLEMKNNIFFSQQSAASPHLRTHISAA